MRTLGQLVAVLLVVGFVGAYFWWIVLAATAAGAVWLAVRGYRAAIAAAAEDAARRAEIVARADRQHQQVMRGDGRGLYGEGWPAHRAYVRALKR